MTNELQRLFGTDDDRVNCPFYFKIGLCRHGDQCSRIHNRPVTAQTLILKHMYQNHPVALALAEGQRVEEHLIDQAQEHFETFYEEVFLELANYGKVDEMAVVDNVVDHMAGSVYVKFEKEEDAMCALHKLMGRFYGGRLIQAELSHVTDFSDARCRQYDDGQCTRGGYCNFVHWKYVPKSLRKKLLKEMVTEHPEYDLKDKKKKKKKKKKKSDSRSRSRSRSVSSAGSQPYVRQPSEERRAMIAKWNLEAGR